MATSKPPTRAYGGSDAAMQQRQRTLRGHFDTHAAEFAAFNPTFDAAFGQQWAAALAAAEAAPAGEARQGQLMADTQAVDAAMEQARQQVQQLFYYVGQAFPHNAGRLATYGKPSYDKARASHERMISLLKQAADAATADQTALAAKGWTPAQTAALAALGTQLATANTTQEQQKGSGVEGGQTYIGLQNALYAHGPQVSLAAKTLYAANPGRRQLFDLTPEGGGPTPPAPSPAP
jgi:hypothetical protein